MVLIGQGDVVLYHHAFGQRTIQPTPEPMSDDTIFDLASLTKVVATTTSIMQLVETGRLRLADPVGQFIPGFDRYRKHAITIRHLLTHTSGLRPDLELDVEFAGTDEAIRRAIEEVPVAAVDERFIYSDINFFVLGEIVRRVSGERLDAYARTHIFEPLRMTDTMFLPSDSLRPRIAPTERCRPLGWPCAVSATDVPFLRGIVHDPTARRMDGFAGHAGLFGTAADLSRFCRMLLNGGALEGVRILAAPTIERMIAPSTPRGMHDVRALGWDLDTTYSTNRGELFPLGSFGHTGFTGTSLWLDPGSKSYVIFLSNRVHPDGKGDVSALRGRVATIAAAAVLGGNHSAEAGAVQRSAEAVAHHRSAEAIALHRSGEAVALDRSAEAVTLEAGASEHTLTGIDVLEAEAFARVRGRRIALLTNQTGSSRNGVSTIDLFAGAKDVALVALLSPEHGLRGTSDAQVADSRDEKTNRPIYSLYGDTQRPTANMLDGVDTVVVDLQDIGARFYTYITTTAYVLEEAAVRKLRVVVLDRPNPINGFDVEGPTLDAAAAGFVGYLPMPIRHGLTIGELATLINGEKKLGADLVVVPMKHWRRNEWFDATALPWANPSPNMRNLLAATLYPGIGALEYANISVGRGTDVPFEQIGAPWIVGPKLADALNARSLPGIRFYPVTFTPAPGAKLGGQPCHGVFLMVTDRDRLRPVRVGVEIAAALSNMYGSQFTLEDNAPLIGSKATIQKIRAGVDPAEIAASWHVDEEGWRRTRARYLLY